MFARHIKNGVAMRYVGQSNKIIDELLKNREICGACGRKYNGTVVRSDDVRICKECQDACK